jgi:hypothetical protein
VTAPLGRSLPLLLIAVLHIGCFAAAGLLSSQIASTKAGQALVHSSLCGYPKKLPTLRTASSRNLTDEDLDIFNSQVLLGRFSLMKSISYVRTCYNGDTAGASDCSHFVRQNLMGERSSVEYKAACPFGGSACLTDAVRYDSGLINSNKDVGINAPLKESVSLRRVTTCAPIRIDNYATEWQRNLPEAYGGKKTNTTTSVKFYEFGLSDTGCTATPPDSITNSTTFCVSQWMKDYLPGAYFISANTAYAEDFNASDFNPVPDFKVSNADVTLISIFNKAVYKGKVDDPLFNAQTPADESNQFYAPTNDFAILGCTEQYQFCDTKTDKCTALSGLYAAQNAVQRGEIPLSSKQKATFAVVWESAWGMAMQWTIKLLNSRVLLAQDWVFTAIAVGSSALPSNQWQHESFNLHNLSLAMFQHRINQYASPETFELAPGVGADRQLVRPTDPNMLDICQSQRVLSAKHYSVSVLGMAIILSIGGLLIMIDQSLEGLWFRYFNAQGRLAKRAEWTQTGTLQLHRQALEARGVGNWDRKNRDFPVIERKGEMFVGLAEREEKIGQMQDDGKAHTYTVVTTEERSLDERDKKNIQ